MSEDEAKNPEAKLPAAWSEQESGASYETSRFRSSRHQGRDLRLVERALHRIEFPLEGRRVLDAPSGTGRLHPLLHDARLVGADRSLEMLQEARRRERGPVLCADLLDLPFASRSFDLVVACRILHHARDGELLRRLVQEFVRVSDRYVIASFFDRQSFHAWRKRHRKRKPGRTARSRKQMEEAFAAAGAEVVGYEHSLRFWSQQTFAVAVRR